MSHSRCSFTLFGIGLMVAVVPTLDAAAHPNTSVGTKTHGMMSLKAEAQFLKPASGNGMVNRAPIEIRSADDHRVSASVPAMAAGSSVGVFYDLEIVVDGNNNDAPSVSANTFITFDDMGRWLKKANLFLYFETVANVQHSANAAATLQKDGEVGAAEADHEHSFLFDPLAP